jgi:cytochrome c oxidase subunit 3
MAHTKDSYYLPNPSHWPLVGSIGLFSLVFGAANWLHGQSFGPIFFGAGALIIAYMLFGWFGKVINENQAGLYNAQVDRSFRWGMGWFIFSEIVFFGAFFGALFYARISVLPWLSGTWDLGQMTHYLLWPGFESAWPLLHNPDPNQFAAPKAVMGAWGLATINTLILLTSGLTITWAHWGLYKNNRKQLIMGLLLTVALGVTFLCCQAYEYIHAYEHMGLKLTSGIYGTTFFMLTGFHGMHVTIGTIMLITILIRSIKGHFTPTNHFAFEGVAWYWHFVDVVWLFLYIFVYWL